MSGYTNDIVLLVTGTHGSSEPVIGPELELPEWIINSDYSTSNVVSLPTITTENGPFR